MINQREARVIQYKMILKQSLIPMQDDPENGRIGMGKPLGNADQNAACGKSYQFTNRRVFEGKCGHRIQWTKPHGSLCLGRKNAGRPGIPAAAQEATGRHPGVLEQGRRVELGADYPTDSNACSDRESSSEELSAAAVHRKVHACRHRTASASGP